MKDLFTKIKEFLDENKVIYKVFTHPEAKTSPIAAGYRAKMLHLPVEEVLKRGAKAMIIRSEGNFYQFVISGAKKFDWKKMKNVLKTKSASLASPDEVSKVSGVEVGAVGPFGNLFDTPIPVFMDESLMDQEEIDFSAGKWDVSIQMRREDYVRIVKPTMVDVSQ